MDYALEYPNPPDKPHGLWPSTVAVTNRVHPSLRLNHQDSLAFYRANQIGYGVLWVDTTTAAVYRLFGITEGHFAPDFRVTERGDYELVGLWTLPSQPPDDGGDPVPAEPGPLVGHPSGRL